jgi:hypothetical protein
MVGDDMTHRQEKAVIRLLVALANNPNIGDQSMVPDILTLIDYLNNKENA